ncbi:hypothetical protein IIA79_02480 [bacterium]|nr:hypothetical protein [bacterium]
MTKATEQQVKPEFTLAEAVDHVLDCARDLAARFPPWARDLEALKVAEPAIRALPELIEAAEDVLYMHSLKNPGPVSFDEACSADYKTRERLRVAIAKARGEEEGG